jgi:hypothetical protein
MRLSAIQVQLHLSVSKNRHDPESPGPSGASLDSVLARRCSQTGWLHRAAGVLKMSVVHGGRSWCVTKQLVDNLKADTIRGQMQCEVVPKMHRTVGRYRLNFTGSPSLPLRLPSIRYSTTSPAAGRAAIHGRLSETRAERLFPHGSLLSQ